MAKTARFLLILVFLILAPLSFVRADELLDVQKNIEQKQSEYSQTQSSLESVKKTISALSGQVFSTQSQVDSANAQVEGARQELAKVEEELEGKRDQVRLVMDLRNQHVRFLYKNPGDSPLELFIGSGGFSSFSQNFQFQKQVLGSAKEIIASINDEITVIEKTRDELATVKADLEAVAAEINARYAALQSQLFSQSNQQNVLSSQISQIEKSLANLTQKQKDLIAAKLAASQQAQTVGDQVPPSTPLPAAGFSPAYAFSSYGYPHRVGMNQYGAFGRANAGQSFTTILHAYYTGIGVGGYPVPGTINVQGYGHIPFEDNYLKGIAEMPSSWPMEALKAQAVAARSYALNWLASHPGQAICTTQACQVYLASKAGDPAATRWHQAVDATRGIVATYGGNPIAAYYSSTDGGYTLSAAAVWGGNVPYAQGVADFAGSWPAGAYDKDSPWFHKPWGGTCGNTGYPWLTKTDVQDLFNALLLSKQSSNYNQHLSPVDGCLGAAGWSHQQVIDELNRLGVAPVGNLQNIFVGYDGHGNTSSITLVSSGYPVLTFSGSEFRSIYHLRSPGTRVIQTSLYDVIIQ